MELSESLKKDDKNELYDEMEKDNLEENHFKEKNFKKRQKKFNFNYILLIIIIIIIIFFITYLLYKKKNSFKITLKPVLSLEYGENNKIRNRKAHLDFQIHSISCFPSGNLIAYDYNMIIIYDNLFTVKQEIYPFEDEFNLIKDFYEQKIIVNLETIDENNFILITNYGSLFLYTKEEGIFSFKKEIIKNEKISSIVFDSKGKIFSLSNDSIKIFEKNSDDNYIIIKKIIIPDMVGRMMYASNNNDNILLLEDKNILIIKQSNSIKFFNMKDNYTLIYTFKEKNIHSIERFGDDKLIVLYNYDNLKVISIYEYKVLKEIKTEIETHLVKYYKEKGIIILGVSYDKRKEIGGSRINILRSDNFELIQTIYEPQYYCIRGIFIHNNDIIGAYFFEGIKTWKIEEH